MLIVRGRCFNSHRNCFRANIALGNLLWNWSKMRRPYVVYQEGDVIDGCWDFVPGWFTREGVYRDLCRCNLLGNHDQGWCCLGALYSNVVCRRNQLFERRCNFWGDVVILVSQSLDDFYRRNARNIEIATGSSRIVMHVLTDSPPSVPFRGEPMVFVVTSRKRKPKWERARRKGIGKRYVERMCHWRRKGRREEREWSGYVDERDSEESSEEESVA